MAIVVNILNVLFISVVVRSFEQIQFESFSAVENSDKQVDVCPVDPFAFSQTTRSILECAILCKTDPKCEFFSYQKSAKVCEIFNGSPQSLARVSGCRMYHLGNWGHLPIQEATTDLITIEPAAPDTVPTKSARFADDNDTQELLPTDNMEGVTTASTPLTSSWTTVSTPSTTSVIKTTEKLTTHEFTSTAHQQLTPASKTSSATDTTTPTTKTTLKTTTTVPLTTVSQKTTRASTNPTTGTISTQELTTFGKPPTTSATYLTNKLTTVSSNATGKTTSLKLAASTTKSISGSVFTQGRTTNSNVSSRSPACIFMNSSLCPSEYNNWNYLKCTRIFTPYISTDCNWNNCNTCIQVRSTNYSRNQK